MLKLNPIILGICSIPFMAGCSLNQPVENDARIEPVISLRHGVSSPADLYQLGRYYQGQARYDEAAAAYRRAVAADPNFVEAHNGLGVIYALQGNHQQAVAEFNAAIGLHPNEALLYNNLGYAYLIHGDNKEAAAALEKALALEPGNQRAMNNLETARVNLAKNPQPAQVAGLNPGPEPVKATPLPEPNPPAPAAEASTHSGDVRAPAETAKAADEPMKKFRLEVSNGNGVTGMAAGVRGFLRQQGVVTSHLTNQKPFNQETTQTQYRSGYRAEAVALNARLPKPGMLVETKKLRQDIQVRLVLGKDIMREKEVFAGELPRRPAHPIQVSHKG